MNVEQRMKIEKQIARKVLACLIDAGCNLTVNDGEGIVVSGTTSEANALYAMFSTDEDIISAYREDGVFQGFVHFVYGNDGYDVISDHSVSLSEILAPATALAEQLEAQYA